MAKKKEPNKLQKFIYKHNKAFTWAFIVLLGIVAVLWKIYTGEVELRSDTLFRVGTYEFTWFHAVLLVVSLVLLGFGINAVIRDRSAEQQEIYRQQREESIRLRKEVEEERRQELQDAYDKMKERRNARLAARGDAQQAWTEIPASSPEQEQKQDNA